MLRVFLVIDDYNELLYLQTLLKKLGFDTEGLQNTKKYADVSLGFNPHVLVTTGRGRKVNGLELIKTINKKRGLPKIIVLHSAMDPISPAEAEELGIDLLLESPTSAPKVIVGLARICDLDENALLEKYNKIKASVDSEDDDEILVADYDETGREVGVQEKMFSLKEERPIGVQFPLKKEATQEDPAIATVDLNLRERPLVSEEDAARRKKRYEEFLAKAEKAEPGRFDRDRIVQFNRKIRSRPLSEDVDEIERDRKEFVRALFENANKKS